MKPNLENYKIKYYDDFDIFYFSEEFFWFRSEKQNTPIIDYVFKNKIECDFYNKIYNELLLSKNSIKIPSHNIYSIEFEYGIDATFLKNIIKNFSSRNIKTGLLIFDSFLLKVLKYDIYFDYIEIHSDKALVFTNFLKAKVFYIYIKLKDDTIVNIKEKDGSDYVYCFDSIEEMLEFNYKKKNFLMKNNRYFTFKSDYLFDNAYSKFCKYIDLMKDKNFYNKDKYCFLYSFKKIIFNRLKKTNCGIGNRTLFLSRKLCLFPCVNSFQKNKFAYSDICNVSKLSEAIKRFEIMFSNINCINNKKCTNCDYKYFCGGKCLISCVFNNYSISCDDFVKIMDLNLRETLL